MNHPDAVATAFDTIHEAMRALRRENCELRKELNKARAAAQLAAQERDDQAKRATQLAAQCKRFGVAA